MVKRKREEDLKVETKKIVSGEVVKIDDGSVIVDPNDYPITETKGSL